MPHLSPLNWLLTPIIILLFLLSLSVIMWWHASPTFPYLTPTRLASASNLWPWW